MNIREEPKTPPAPILHPPFLKFEKFKPNNQYMYQAVHTESVK